MFENNRDPVDVASMLKDVRGTPLEDLLAAECADLDDALTPILHGLASKAESLTAFSSVP